MTTFQSYPLGQLATIERNTISPREIKSGTTYVGLENIGSDGSFIAVKPVNAGDLASSKFQFTCEHILFGKLRPYLKKIAAPDFSGVCSTDILPIKPGPRLDAKYLLQYLRQPHVTEFFSSQSVGVNLPRVSPSLVASLCLFIPCLSEQRRIADILDWAEVLRTKRRAALAQLDELTRALFLDMFGDPVANPKAWTVKSLTEGCHCSSGGTPSKGTSAFWEGPIPWFSPKDLKSSDLWDSIDHISEQAAVSSRLQIHKPGTVLIVVRGMILAHTFPVGTLRTHGTINQDMKALKPRIQIEPEFLAASLRNVANFALSQASESAHGTKRLDSNGLCKIPILVPPLALQQEFAHRVRAIDRIKAHHRQSLAEMDALFQSLQHRAFRGEL